MHQIAAVGIDNIGKGKVEVKRTVCTHCSVGCAVDAVVENGVWVRQEPVFDSPINLGAHCAKGAAIREHGHGEHRLRYPMKLVNGKYQRISWDVALQEIADKMNELRKASGPDSVYFVGSSKHNNEQAYLLRKFVSINVSPSNTNSSGGAPEYFALSRREGGSILGATGGGNGYCAMQVYVDDVRMPVPFNLDMLPSPRLLSGIEVYAGSATLPAKYNTMDSGCGVVLVWTKDGY